MVQETTNAWCVLISCCGDGIKSQESSVKTAEVLGDILSQVTRVTSRSVRENKLGPSERT
jgi:hypothetical protein